jgi:dTDP-4-amino-4,6-dideoxygalactose transaminase
MQYVWRCDLTPQYEAYKAEIDEAIQRVLRSGRYILAGELAAFEKEYAAYIGAAQTVGVANATDGLTLALRALGVGPGDEVITTPFTAIPTVSAIVDAGATPVFADIDPETYLLDVEKAAAALTPRVKAVMPVHLFGSVVDVPRLRAACGKVPIVEDASQSHGSTLRGVQSGSMGELGVFSFYPTKNLGGYGDGGAVVTSSPKTAETLRLLRMYGMTDKDHIVVNGINSRLDELQAAILRVKLRHLDAMNARRREIAALYGKLLDQERFIPQRIPEGVVSNYHVYVVRYRGDRAALMRRLEDAKIQTNVYYELPLHLQEANRFLGKKPGDFPNAEALCSQALALPLYPEIPLELVETVAKAVRACDAAAASRP